MTRRLAFMILMFLGTALAAAPCAAQSVPIPEWLVIPFDLNADEALAGSDLVVVAENKTAPAEVEKVREGNYFKTVNAMKFEVEVCFKGDLAAGDEISVGRVLFVSATSSRGGGGSPPPPYAFAVGERYLLHLKAGASPGEYLLQPNDLNPVPKVPESFLTAFKKLIEAKLSTDPEIAATYRADVAIWSALRQLIDRDPVKSMDALIWLSCSKQYRASLSEEDREAFLATLGAMCGEKQEGDHAADAVAEVTDSKMLRAVYRMRGALGDEAAYQKIIATVNNPALAVESRVTAIDWLEGFETEKMTAAFEIIIANAGDQLVVQQAKKKRGVLLYLAKKRAKQ